LILDLLFHLTSFIFEGGVNIFQILSMVDIKIKL